MIQLGGFTPFSNPRKLPECLEKETDCFILEPIKIKIMLNKENIFRNLF